MERDKEKGDKGKKWVVSRSKRKIRREKIRNRMLASLNMSMIPASLIPIPFYQGTQACWLL